MKDNNIDLFTAAILNKPNREIFKKDLIPINNLKVVFRDIRDYFAGNVTGITRDEKIAQNIMRLLFCKIFDEQNKNDSEIVEFSNKPNENAKEFGGRIKNLFSKVKKKYPDIFENDEEIEILPEDLSYIIKLIEEYSIFNADRDVIADAFEELIGRAFRGGEGQFFTPRNVVQMMIDVLQPKSNEKIIDPACGSGGFLAHILKQLIKTKADNYTICGLDKDLFLSKLAKIYLTLIGGKTYSIFCENSLEQPKKWKTETQNIIKLNTFDLILTNPPFGAKIPVIGESLLKQYNFGYRWKEENNNWHITKELLDKQPPQVLFIERCIQLLKEGGRLGIVLPEGIFGNPSDRYILEYIQNNTKIIGVVSLSQETFQPSTHTKTSVLFLEKKKQNQNSVFMAIAKSIGHNKNGKETYKLNKDGSYIIDKNNNKIIDDDLPEISNNFKKYLNGKLKTYGRLGFKINKNELSNYIYIPEFYNPEITNRLKELEKSGIYNLMSFGELLNNNYIQIKRGNEIGSQFYGTGIIPFVRTTDIVNWEIKMDPIKAVADEIYEQYKSLQDIKANDILFVNDGTFLIGRAAFITRLDEKIIIQSHLKKIRVLKNDILTPYYLFYLLNTKIVKQQIESKTFVQATISTLGNRLNDLILPIYKDKQEIQKISVEIQNIIEEKTLLRERSIKLLDNGL
ncbi:MAG TPA: N-6 DNA methylase [bacterium]|nr:N-6 DNA methylase [bacterium]